MKEGKAGSIDEGDVFGEASLSLHERPKREIIAQRKGRRWDSEGAVGGSERHFESSDK